VAYPDNPYANRAPSRGRRRRPFGGLAWVGIIIVVGTILLVAATGVSALAGVGPAKNMFRDKGVRACAALAATKTGQRIDTRGLGSGGDGLAVLRNAFAHSRYADLRTAGTAAIDLLRQYQGGNGDQVSGLAIVAGGQMVDRWAALAGACTAHGVTIPSLAEMGK
jgi:hypothetical protein